MCGVLTDALPATVLDLGESSEVLAGGLLAAVLKSKDTCAVLASGLSIVAALRIDEQN
jgi:hypothetical protein